LGELCFRHNQPAGVSHICYEATFTVLINRTLPATKHCSWSTHLCSLWHVKLAVNQTKCTWKLRLEN